MLLAHVTWDLSIFIDMLAGCINNAEQWQSKQQWIWVQWHGMNFKSTKAQGCGSQLWSVSQLSIACLVSIGYPTSIQVHLKTCYYYCKLVPFAAIPCIQTIDAEFVHRILAYSIHIVNIYKEHRLYRNSLLFKKRIKQIYSVYTAGPPRLLLLLPRSICEVNSQ